MTEQTSAAVSGIEPPARRMNRVRIAVLAGTVLAAVIGLADIAPAVAHDELLAASPEDGQVVETAPAAVELEFSNDIIEMGTAIILFDTAGDQLAVGEPVIAGRTVTATLPPDVADGDYQLRWRVVSSDGHPIEGTIDFGVGVGATGDYAAATASDDASDQPDDAEQTDAQDSGETSPASGSWPIVAGIVGGLAAIALVVTLIIRTIRRNGGTSS